MNPPSDTAAIAWADPARERAFAAWLGTLVPRHGLRAETLRSASSDASFRRYLRVDGAAGASFIVMDAPPPQEDVRPFVAVARGDTKATDTLMRDAIAALVQWQARGQAGRLPPYDDALLRRELALFPDWCVQREFGVTWTPAQQSHWQSTCDALVASALGQPTVAVHRDYMPRNLMLASPNPGILDFQDAVRGPITYDVASLLRDAFISWDEAQEIDWAVRYWQAARQAGLPVPDDFADLWRQIEWMGLQRHLKVLGIFCRLKHRDGKPKYSEDLPRFFAYAHKVATRYHGLGPLAHLLEPLMGTRRVDAFY